MYYSCNAVCVFVFYNELYLILTEQYYLNPKYIMNRGGKNKKQKMKSYSTLADGGTLIGGIL